MPFKVYDIIETAYLGLVHGIPIASLQCPKCLEVH